MTEQTAPKDHLLACHEKRLPVLELINAADLKVAARFWFGTTASNKMQKAACVNALTGLFKDRGKLEAGLGLLPEKERQVLAVLKRYGGAVSGAVLLGELLARGLVEKEAPARRPLHGRLDDDPVLALGRKLLVLDTSGGGMYGSSNSYYSYSSSRNSYPDLSIHPGVRGLIDPAGPLSWKPSAPAAPPSETVLRSPAEVVLDLGTVAEALGQAGNWRTIRGGSPAKSVQNRLEKVLPADSNDPVLPPAPSLLYYELLRSLGAIEIEEGGEGRIDLEFVKRQLGLPETLQAWAWARAWLPIALWQDGIGVVPDRDNFNAPVRISPSSLGRARDLLVWALSRVAHGPDDWLDLEGFLTDLWSATGKSGISFVWSHYTWKPGFASARDKAEIDDAPARQLAYWLDDEGTWAANALLGTLAFLGLVERGRGGTSRAPRYCFRLTGLGKAVFGAPELAGTAPACDPRFLAVQPNFEVLVYLDSADARMVWPLARMGRRASVVGNHVQTFALTRESIYQALESGLKLEEVRQYLTEHSRTGLPANVERSLSDWGRRREALVLRPDVSLAVFPAGGRSTLQAVPGAEAVGDRCVLLPRTVARGLAGYPVVDHNASVKPTWRVDPEGRVRTTAETDVLSLARLAQFADADGGGWKITTASVRRARERGIPADQVLAWLGAYTINTTAPMVETAIRNWSSPAAVFLDEVVLLQIRQPQACEAIRNSPRFQPLLLGHLPPDCFLIAPEKRQELERLLAELGFASGAAFRLPEPPGESRPAQGSTGGKHRGRPRKK